MRNYSFKFRKVSKPQEKTWYINFLDHAKNKTHQQIQVLRATQKT